MTRLLFLSLFAAAAPASAKRKTERQAALFVIAKDPPAADMVTVVRDALRDIATSAPQLDVIVGKSLRKRLKAEPGAAIEACGADLGCIAKLARKARALEAIYVRVGVAAGGFEAQVVVVDSRRARLTRRTTVRLSRADAARAAFLGSFEEVFGVKGDGKLAAPAVSGEVVVDGLAVGRGPGPYLIAPGRHTVVIEGVASEVVIEPGRLLALRADGARVYDPPLPGAAERAAAEDAESAAVDVEPELPELELEVIPELAAVSPEKGAPAPAATTAGSAASGLFRWTGIAALAFGAASLGAGAWFGLERRAAEREVRGKSQIDTIAIVEEANANAQRANVLLAAGGVLAAIGGVVLAVDVASSGARLEAHVAPEGGTLRLAIDL